MNIFKLSSEIEKLLREVGGTGVGLKELRMSLGSTISDDINNKIIRIGSLRNKVAHDGYEPTINELRIYTTDSSEVISALNSLINRDGEYIESFSIEVMAQTYLYEYIPREFHSHKNHHDYIVLVENIENILSYYSQKTHPI
ncbi:hypothetical protein XQ44_20255 [Salmonella enterica]|nr:hypothetical protein [Salmonella enterica]EBP1427342.1 hypothetical protein [Salmonella enterica]